MLGLDTDNDTVLINETIKSWCEAKDPPLTPPGAEPALEAFLASLRLAWKEGEIRPTAGSCRRIRCERATACRNSGAVATRPGEWTATCSA